MACYLWFNVALYKNLFNIITEQELDKKIVGEVESRKCKVARVEGPCSGRECE